MIKMLLAFIVFWVAFFVGIDAFQKMTGKEKWQLTKMLGYAAACAFVTIMFLVGIVIVF